MNNKNIIKAFANGDFEGECALISALKTKKENMQKLECLINTFSFLMDISPSKKITLVNEDIDTSWDIRDLLDEKTYHALYKHVLSEILALLNFNDEEYNMLEKGVFGENYFERGEK